MLQGEMNAANTFDNPEKVVPVSYDVVADDGKLLLKKHSITVVSMTLK